METIRIRAARAGEADVLTDLCVRSKAHWGYDAEFMKASFDALTITESMIANRLMLVAEDEANGITGVIAAESLGTADAFDLSHLFVSPDALRRGIGEKLFAAMIALLRREKAQRLVILADPNAAAFYERVGAKAIGDAPSDAIPGRRLPLLEFKIA